MTSSPTATADTDALAEVAPLHPDAPGVPFPHVAEDAYDAELEAIAEARGRSAARAVMVARVLAIAASIALAFALRHDLRYALASPTPIELSPTASAAELDAASHHLVSMNAVPGGVGAVDYRRPMQDGVYRLAPLVGRADVYVELRLPDGVDASRFVPPTLVSGRLVPLDEGGARFSSVRDLLARTTGRAVPAKAWLLENGAQPSLRAPGAIVALLASAMAVIQLALLLGSRKSRPRLTSAA